MSSEKIEIPVEKENQILRMIIFKGFHMKPPWDLEYDEVVFGQKLTKKDCERHYFRFFAESSRFDFKWTEEEWSLFKKAWEQDKINTIRDAESNDFFEYYDAIGNVVFPALGFPVQVFFYNDVQIGSLPDKECYIRFVISEMSDLSKITLGELRDKVWSQWKDWLSERNISRNKLNFRLRLTTGLREHNYDILHRENLGEEDNDLIDFQYHRNNQRLVMVIPDTDIDIEYNNVVIATFPISEVKDVPVREILDDLVTLEIVGGPPFYDEHCIVTQNGVEIDQQMTFGDLDMGYENNLEIINDPPFIVHVRVEFDENPMRLRNMTARNYMTVGVFKETLAEHYDGLTSDDIRLLVHEGDLCDDDNIRWYDIKEGDTLHAKIRSRGGGGKKRTLDERENDVNVAIQMAMNNVKNDNQHLAVLQHLKHEIDTNGGKVFENIIGKLSREQLSELNESWNNCSSNSMPVVLKAIWSSLHSSFNQIQKAEADAQTAKKLILPLLELAYIKGFGVEDGRGECDHNIFETLMEKRQIVISNEEEIERRVNERLYNLSTATDADL